MINREFQAIWPLFQEYGAEVIASDMAAIVMGYCEIPFPGMYYDPEYVTVKGFRTENTSDCTMVLVKQFIA